MNNFYKNPEPNHEDFVTCIIGLYVDDMLITGAIQKINNIVNKIKLKLKISKSGNINYILGIKIEFYNNSYFISQKILKKFIKQL